MAVAATPTHPRPPREAQAGLRQHPPPHSCDTRCVQGNPSLLAGRQLGAVVANMVRDAGWLSVSLE